MGPYAVLDVETTGLDWHQDGIVQVAVYRFDGREWSSFVNPERPVPLAVRQLSGFESIDFTKAPSMVAIKEELLDFIGNACWVGHNIHFDMRFLAQYGIVPATAPVDTLWWSRLAFPLHGHYALSDWDTPWRSQLHDARADVRATHALLERIHQQMSNFSADLKRDLARFLGAEWSWWEISAEHGPGSSALYTPGPDRFESRELEKRTVSDTVQDRLGPDGASNWDMDGFEVREGQLTMARAVDEALTKKQILLVEAGTGTGKSLAYLTPAVIQSLEHGERTVVATYTVALQEQLWFKDLPQVQRNLPIAAALVKGRGRYLCLYKTAEVVQDSAVLGESRERRWALATLLSYIEATSIGDVEEFPLHDEAGQSLWGEIMADSHSCAGSHCPFAGPCFMRRARHIAEASHLVIVNHALLASHLAQGGVLPPFTRLVVDEAHHFAEVLERTLGFELDAEDWEHRYREAVLPGRGLLARLNPPAEMLGSVYTLRDRYQQVDALLRRFGERLVMLTAPGEYDRRSVRMTEDMAEVLRESGDDALAEQVADWLSQLVDLGELLWEEAESRGLAETAIWLRFRQWQQDLAEASMGLKVWGQISDERVSWWEVRTGRNGQPFVTWRWAPVDIAPLVNDRLWSDIKSAILTSATLSVDGQFDYVADILGIPEDRRVDLAVPSPFIWDRQARLIVPSDGAPIDSLAYWDNLTDVVQSTAVARMGHVLVLLTSYRAVRILAERVRSHLQSHQIRTMAQNIDGPARRLVLDFRQNPRAVLIGTMTFWEGVDIPGDDLQVVVMGRLPFKAPGDPLEEAKLDRIRGRGQSPFYRRTLPEAILRFEQGFGRLIRTKADRGVVIVCDPRLQPGRTRYGSAFLKALSLVPCQIIPQASLVSSLEEFWRTREHAHSD